jgi:hypothetical protein
MLNKRLVKDYLIKESGRDLSKIIERELKVDIIRDKAICIIGPRRAGKTYFLYKLRERFPTFLHVNFENIAFKGFRIEEIYDLISLFVELFGEKPQAIFLDEVQMIQNWETLVRSLLDSEEYFVFVSGSSSKLLSKEIATQLRGRSISYFLLPFSLREFLKAKQIAFKKPLMIEEEGKIKREVLEYLKWGGYPEVVLKNNRERILREYFNTILYNDFVERFKIENIGLAKFLFEFMFQNFSKEMSGRKILNFLRTRVEKFGKNTVYDYLNKLPETLSVFFIERVSKSTYVRKSWPKKVYVCDTGIATAIGFSEDIGKRMENIVFLELLRETNKNPLTEIYYWRDYQQHEVDFVVKEGINVNKLIQVTYASARDEIEKREIRSLLKASEQLKCKNLLCITWDYEASEEIKEKKIKFIPLWKFLLNLSSP